MVELNYNNMRIRFHLFVSFFLTSFFLISQNPSNVVINEFVSSNSESAFDEDGESSDWIELYNSGTSSVSLEGWGLSDNESKPFKWVFPNVIIKPNEYLIVWASGKDRAPAQGSMVQGIKRQVYLDISGTSISDLTNSSNFPNSPSYVENITNLFEAPIDENDYYGQRMSGLLKAPETGNYIFWISSDDDGQLFLSSDESVGNQRLVASVSGYTNSRQWDKYSSQKSESIYLEKDKYYFISALMKEGAGGDNLAVGWQLPSGTVQRPMPASYIYNTDGELHTNFSISADGEPLTLTNKNGETVHYIPEVPLITDISYGLKEGETGFWYFETPTPGESNSSKAYSELLDTEIIFSYNAGFYPTGFGLELTASDPDVQIYYTLDGSEPSKENLNGSSYLYKNNYPRGSLLTNEVKSYLYQSPIEIKDRTSESYKLGKINTVFSSGTNLPNSNYYKGTVVRAKAYKEGTLSHKSYSNTYFITQRGKSRYELPVISLSVNEKDFFDYYEGIYVAGKVADDWRAANPYANFDGGTAANYHLRGRLWEKPAYFEFFDKNGDFAYEHAVGVRMHGGWSRANARKSIRIYARSQYGTGDRLEYPFFEDLRAKGNSDYEINSFKRLLLRNSGNDFDHTLYRDALMSRLVDNFAFTTMASQPVIHFINGEYWGIMNIRERYDRYYLESHFSIPNDKIVILDAWGGVVEGSSQDREQFYNILSFAESNNISLSSNYEWIKNRVDVESLAGFYAAQIYFNNEDWPHNNQKFWRYRDGVYREGTPRGIDGRWGWLLYDTDFGMSLWHDKSALNGLARVMDTNATDPSSRLFRRLLKNEKFKNLFINIASDQFNSSFKPQYVTSMVNDFNSGIASSRTEHYNRWKNGTDTGQSIKSFGNNRPGNARLQMKNEFGLSFNTSIVINRVGEGLVKINTIIVDKNLKGANSPNPYPWEGIYFKNIPIRLEAIDTDGYRFSHWDGVSTDVEKNRIIEVALEDDAAITAVFKKYIIEDIHYWHFNDLPKGSLDIIEADVSLQSEPGIAYYSGSGDGYMDRVNEGTELNAETDVEAGYALRVRNPSNNRYLDFDISTLNYQDIKISYAVNRTNNGSDKQRVFIKSSQGEDWKIVKSTQVITEQFQLVELDLTTMSEVNDNPDLKFRVAFTGDAASGESGNNRFDNFVVKGSSTKNTKINSSKMPEFSVNVFPNPAVDEIRIVSSNLIKYIELFDIQGQKLKNYKVSGFTHKINLINLPKGIYILNIVNEANIVQKKVIIE